MSADTSKILGRGNGETGCFLTKAVQEKRWGPAISGVCTRLPLPVTTATAVTRPTARDCGNRLPRRRRVVGIAFAAMHSDITIRAPLSVETGPVDFSITPPPLLLLPARRPCAHVNMYITNPVSPKSLIVVPDKTKVRTACRRTNDRTTNSVSRHIAASDSMGCRSKSK